MIEDCLSLFFGYRCHICDRTLARGILCSRCSPRVVDTISWPRCSCCFGILKAPWEHSKIREEMRCELCTAYPMPYSKCRYIFEYTEGLRHTIRYAKYHPSYLMAKELIRHAFKKLTFDLHIADYDLITVIPPSIRGSWKRDFHLPGLFAYALSTTTEPLQRPHCIETLSHRWYITPQASLRVKKRIKNMQHSWSVIRKIEGQKILLIDDVITSGSTIISAAHALKDAGACHVDVLALTRSPNFERTQQTICHSFWQ